MHQLLKNNNIPSKYFSNFLLQWFISKCEFNIFFQIRSKLFNSLYFRARHHFTPGPSPPPLQIHSAKKPQELHTIPKEEISGVQLQCPPCTCIGPTINFHPDIDPKITVDPVIHGEEESGGLSSMEVFAWVTLGVLTSQVICTMISLLFKKCNCPKISKSFKFLYLLLNIVLLIISNINDPPKIIEIIEKEFLKIFQNDPPANDELLPLLALPAPK